jgi:prepilin-type N-terminal cleavage/methylation domain-containing protein
MSQRRFNGNHSQGFTLVELLVALAISGLVAMAAYTVFSTSNWSSVIQDQVSAAQQNVRVGMDRLSADIRTAGFGLPDPPFSLSIGGSTISAPISITNSSTGPDSITVLGIGYLAGTLDSTVAAGCNSAASDKICLDSVASFLNSATPPGFKTERKYISLDGVKFIELDDTQGSLTGKILMLHNPPTLDRNYPDGTAVYIVQAVTYSIETDGSPSGCTSANPCLASNDLTDLRGSGQQVMADNIEDMQFAFNLKGSPSFINNASSDSTDILAVRMNLVGRTNKPDFKASAGFTRPALEDHPTSSADGYRRRSLTSIIKIRNPKSSS